MRAGWRPWCFQLCSGWPAGRCIVRWCCRAPWVDFPVARWRRPLLHPISMPFLASAPMCLAARLELFRSTSPAIASSLQLLPQTQALRTWATIPPTRRSLPMIRKFSSLGQGVFRVSPTPSLTLPRHFNSIARADSAMWGRSACPARRPASFRLVRREAS